MWVYIYHLHQNNGVHLDEGITDDAEWQRCFHLLVARSAVCYATPQGVVGCSFTALLATEFQGFLDQSCTSKRPVLFTHVVLTKTLGVFQAIDIQSHLSQQMDL